MKALSLENFGVQKLNAMEMKETDGGFIFSFGKWQIGVQWGRKGAATSHNLNQMMA